MTIGHSILAVTSAATNTELVPIVALRNEIGVADFSEDVRLTRLSRSASRAFAGTAGLSFAPWRQVYTESLAGFGRSMMFLGVRPIESVASILLDGATVDSSTYEIAGEYRDRLYRQSGWWSTPAWTRGLVDGIQPGGDRLDYVVSYTAGWLMPADVPIWRATTVKAVADWVMPVTVGTSVFLFEATVAGTTGASEPTWPTTIGGTVVDSTVTWTAREAQVLPDDLVEAAIWQIRDWFDGDASGGGAVVEEQLGTHEVTYRKPENRTRISPRVSEVLGSYR